MFRLHRMLFELSITIIISYKFLSQNQIVENQKCPGNGITSKHTKCTPTSHKKRIQFRNIEILTWKEYPEK